MCKKIIFIIIISFFITNCQYRKPDSKGEFNEIIIVSSIEDKNILEPIVDEYIFKNIIHTPEPEFLYSKKWITPDGFQYYKDYSNIIIISVSDPIDESVDHLMRDFEIKHKIEQFPVTIKNTFSFPQIITLIKGANNKILKDNLNQTANQIRDIIDTHIDSLYFFRYKKFIKKNKKDTTLISGIINKMFNLNMFLDSDFKIIDSLRSDNNFLWIGKGSIQADNSAAYQWLIIKDIKFIDIKGNLDLLKILDENLNTSYPDINLISTFNEYSKINFKYKTIYKIYSLYNHNLYKTGGPLLAYLIQDNKNKECILLYGLINAPGKSKIKYIKELETIIINSIF